jgi:hypothetical protein
MVLGWPKLLNRPKLSNSFILECIYYGDLNLTTIYSNRSQVIRITYTILSHNNEYKHYVLSEITNMQRKHLFIIPHIRHRVDNYV